MYGEYIKFLYLTEHFTNNTFVTTKRGGCIEGRLFTAVNFLVFCADRITSELDASWGGGDRTPPSIPKNFELATLTFLLPCGNREAVDNLLWRAKKGWAGIEKNIIPLSSNEFPEENGMEDGNF